MKKQISLVLLISLLLFSVGCNNGTTDGNGDGNGNGNGDGNGQKILSSISIANAKNLFIAPMSSASLSLAYRAAGDTTVNKLFKITDNGYVQEIEYNYEDENGNPITSNEVLTPKSIFVLNTDYLIVSFFGSNYLVNSSTGACYAYTNDLPYPDQNEKFYNGEYIASDNNGNIYFINSNGGPGSVKKLSVSDPNNISIVTASVSSDTVRLFGVDKDGNIAYEGKDSGNNGVLRYRNNTGSLQVLPGSTNLSFTTFWTGLNGKLYYYNLSNTGTYIKEIASPFSISDYGNNGWVGVGFNPSIGIAGLLTIKNKNLIIGYNQSGAVELYNETQNNATAIPYSGFNLASSKFGIASDDYYYLAGTSTGSPTAVLLRIDPSDNTYTTLINGQYDIYKMSVGNDEVITFNAIRMADGAIVIGQISSSGVIEILDQTLNVELTVLERIK
jgi:hypothetical protein